MLLELGFIASACPTRKKHWSGAKIIRGYVTLTMKKVEGPEKKKVLSKCFSPPLKSMNCKTVRMLEMATRVHLGR